MDKADILDAAKVALEEKKYDDAIAILEEILQEGVDLEALEVKGDAFRLMGDPKEAMKCYDRALVIDLHQKSIWKSKGIALLAVGRQDEAGRSFDKCVNIDPDYVDGWLGRGRMGMKMHDWDLALESFEKVTDLDADNDAGWYNKANALITGFGRMEEAMECYLKAIDLNPDSDEYYFSLGVAYKSTGTYLDAAKNFNIVLDLNRDHSLAKKYLKECADALGSEGVDVSEFVGETGEGGEEPPEPPTEEDEEEDWADHDGAERGGEEPPAPPAEEEEKEEEEDWGAPPVGASDEDGFFTDWVDMEGDSFAYDPPAPPPEEEEENEEFIEEEVEEEPPTPPPVEERTAAPGAEDEGKVEDWGASPVGATDEDGFFTDWVDMEGDSFAFEITEEPETSEEEDEEVEFEEEEEDE